MMIVDERMEYEWTFSAVDSLHKYRIAGAKNVNLEDFHPYMKKAPRRRGDIIAEWRGLDGNRNKQ